MARPHALHTFLQFPDLSFSVCKMGMLLAPASESQMSELHTEHEEQWSAWGSPSAKLAATMSLAHRVLGTLILIAVSHEVAGMLPSCLRLGHEVGT
jgi:hypothetical protein